MSGSTGRSGSSISAAQAAYELQWMIKRNELQFTPIEGGGMEITGRPSIASGATLGDLIQAGAGEAGWEPYLNGKASTLNIRTTVTVPKAVLTALAAEGVPVPGERALRNRDNDRSPG